MEITALVLSILSLIGTVLLTIWEIGTNIKINQINLKSNICEKIFDEYLIRLIPQARRYLDFDKNDKFVGAKELQNVLISMLKDALFFRYNDRKFYDALDAELQSLEDLLVNNMNKSVERIKQNDLLNNIEEKLKKIYDIIEQKKIKG